VRGVGNQFQKTTAESYKSDREMTVCEMQAAQDKARRDHDEAQREYAKKIAALKKSGATVSKDILNLDTSAKWDIGLGRLYCNAMALIAPKKAAAQGVSTAERLKAKQRPPPTLQSASSTAQAASSTAAVPPIGRLVRDEAKAMSQSALNQTDLTNLELLRGRLQDTAQLMNSYGVEIHKKFALAVACFVFVLLGAPIALRFPRGGVGLTIGVSLFVFALYYVCLIAGESIAKRGLMPAVVSMWMANVIFGLIALWLLARMGQEGSTTRGGDMKEMIGAIKGYIRSRIGWKNRRVQRERLAT
jgi:lipopolysaccharide export system permease protein